MTALYLFALSFFVIGLGALGLIGLALPIVDRARDILKTAALDVVQIYAASHNAELDIKERQARYEFSRDFAQLKLTEQRQRLSGPVESEANQ